jgi:hypothetical protein
MNTTQDRIRGKAPCWIGAIGKAFHPMRWGLCLIGLLASLVLITAVQSLFGMAAPPFEAWWQDPLAALSLLGGQFIDWLSRSPFLRGGVLVLALSPVWGLVGGWIARSEFLSHLASSQPAQVPPRSSLSAAQFLPRKAVSLCSLTLYIVIFIYLCLVPGLIAGLINRALPFGIGALLVAVFLPVVMLASLLITTLLVGSLSYPIMPAAMAAEESDVFDALSRGFSYCYQCPLAFPWWEGLSLTISSLPGVGVFLLLDRYPDLVGSQGRPFVAALAGALSLSIFWTLQSLVYLKLRRLVDGTPENEIWDQPLEENSRTQPETEPPAQGNLEDVAGQPLSEEVLAPGFGAGAGMAQRLPGSPQQAPVGEPGQAKLTELSFGDTLDIGGAGNWGRQGAGLFVASLWMTLVLAGGAWAAWHLGLGGAPDFTAANIRAAVWNLIEERPAELAILTAGLILLGALGLARPLKRAARKAALEVVFHCQVGSQAVRPFLDRTRRQGIVSVVLLTIGIEFAGAAGFLLALVVQGTAPWEEFFLLAGLGIGSFGLGAFGLGALAVRAWEREDATAGTVSLCIRNNLETLASGVVNLAAGLWRFGLLAGCFFLMWLLTCTGFFWWGGEHYHWIRWGLEGTLIPEGEGGLYQGASVIAGLWFLPSLAFIATYPITFTLRWGVIMYLRCRQQVEEIPAGHLELSEEERAALASLAKHMKDLRGAVPKRLRRT